VDYKRTIKINNLCLTAAVVVALTGTVIVIAIRTIKDIPTALIALATIIVLLKTKKVKEPHIILIAAIIGLVLKYFSYEGNV
jgi:chromate transporter